MCEGWNKKAENHQQKHRKPISYTVELERKYWEKEPSGLRFRKDIKFY